MKLLFTVLEWVNKRLPCPYKRECGICGMCRQCMYHGAPCIGVSHEDHGLD